jgi:BON domain
MADRNEWERERDRERNGGRWDWDRGREWSEHGEGGPEYRGREDWGREEYGRGLERYREHAERGDWVRGAGRGEGREPKGHGEIGRSGEGWGGMSERGRYAGRGPKNYVRSDQRIWEDVNECLTENAYIDATDIEVQVKEGEVTLTGAVEDRRSKRLAEDLAESVTGVKEVHNQLSSHSRQHSWAGEEGERGSAIITRKAS